MKGGIDLQFLAGLALLAGAGLWPLLSTGVSVTRFLTAPLLFAFAGVGLIDWRLMFVLLGLAACAFLCLYVATAEERRYLREFPVFQEPPVEVFKRKDGVKLHLHVSKAERGFIIGISYMGEVADSAMPMETRWRDVFPDLESARVELMKRLKEFVPTEEVPNPSIESTSPGKPGTAAHLKR